MLKAGNEKIAVRTPLIYRFKRFNRMRAYRYRMPEFFEAMEQLDKPEYDPMKKANLIDVIVRKAYSLEIHELSQHLNYLERLGGFEKAADFNYVFTSLKRYPAGYEYYKEWPFKSNIESASYISVLAFYVQEFKAKFSNDEPAKKNAQDFVLRSFPFWVEQFDKFAVPELIFLSRAIAQISKNFEIKNLNDFSVKLQTKAEEFTKIENPQGIHSLLEANDTFKILSQNQLEKLKAKLDKAPKVAANRVYSDQKKNSSAKPPSTTQ